MLPRVNSMYREEMNEKELFNEMLKKAVKRPEKYDCISINTDGMVARINGSGNSPIKNGILVMEKNSERTIWHIENFHKVQYPGIFIALVKNEKEAGVCIEKMGMEDVYLFRKQGGECSCTNLAVIGVVEIEEYAVAFYFDMKETRGYYILTEEDDDESDLFKIMKKMLNIKEDVYEPGYQKRE